MIAFARALIDRPKDFAKRHWPALHLRTILFSVLLITAALPGFSAIFLRVYENTLVRQTEAELVAQSAALSAAAAALWPGAPPLQLPPKDAPDYFQPEPLSIDLSSTPVLASRPPPVHDGRPADPAAVKAAALLGPVIETTRRTTLASVIMTDAKGRVVWGGDPGESYANLPEVQAALAGRPQTELRRFGSYQQRYAFEWLSRASALRIHHARPVIVNGRVVGVLLLSRSSRALFKGVYQDRYKILLGVAGTLVLMIIMTGLVSRGVTRPVEALSAASRQVALGEGDIPETPRTAAIEIRALYEDFRRMAEAIARRSRYLRDFASAVSHEFKTPLAGIRGGVELLEDHHETMSQAERKRFLGNISADAERLSQLVARLLDLARADMARPEAGVAVDIAPAVRRVADAVGGEGFVLTVDLPSDLPTVAVPDATIETVLTALLQNSRQAGAGSATVRAWTEDAVVILSVSDDGPGIAPADRVRLFEPFFTSRRAEGGTGLGLSIARSLLAASGAAIDLRGDGPGTTFAMTLPASRTA